MAKAPMRTAPPKLLVELIKAFRERGVVPSGGGKWSVPTFTSAVPNTQPLHKAMSAIQHTWVITTISPNTKKSGPYVKRDEFAAWLGEQISCPPEEALWRFAALMSWSEKFQDWESQNFPCGSLLTGDRITPTVSDIVSALSATPPVDESKKAKEETWAEIASRPPVNVTIPGAALLTCLVFTPDLLSVGPTIRELIHRVGSATTNALLLAAIARDSGFEPTAFADALTRHPPGDFLGPVVDALLNRASWLRALQGWNALPNDIASPLAEWMVFFRFTDHHWKSAALSPDKCVLWHLNVRLNRDYGESPITTDGTPEQHAILRLYEHLEMLEKNSYGMEHESHLARAAAAATQAGYLLAAFAPSLIRAFADALANELVEILSAASDDRLLERIRPLTDGQHRLEKIGAIADTILRRCGAIPIASEVDARPLLGTLAPIRGQTWLNDLGLENLLHEAARAGELAFADEYSRAWREHEDDLLRDLFDVFVAPKLMVAIQTANQVLSKPGRRWYLRWSKFSKNEEFEHGADLALEVKVMVHQQIEFRKTCFVQVKRMETKGERFLSSWRLNAQQRADLLREFGSTAFYLLLTPAAVSGQQRVLPVDVADGILLQARKQEILPDSVAGCCCHSLAHFLIYDVLAGWQGDVTKSALQNPKTAHARPGRSARYIVRVELEYGG
jgi:hypothetical protein